LSAYRIGLRGRIATVSSSLATLIAALITLAFSMIGAAAADWTPVERIEPYAISGATGPELYASIGERGPQIGSGRRAVAFTDFKLTWTRDYREEGGACRLASAKPKLTITYRVPKPARALSGKVKGSWDTFAAGILAHEKVHGEMIVDMVRQIEAQTVGLTVADDRGCRKIRTEMTRILSGLSQAQRQKSRDFDRVEMSDGGPVHRLILALLLER
jgi:predicted secreted Zn-dependent protease